MTTRIRPQHRVEIMNPDQIGVVVVDPPATSSSPGVPGTVAWDASYFYVCVDTDTWVRATLATW